MSSSDEWIDLTHPISEHMATWPGQPKTKLAMVDQMCCGGVANVTSLSMSVHSGTHVDAPCHFIQGGADIQSMPVDLMHGSARMVQVSESSEHVSKADILEYERRCGDLGLGDRVVFKTRNSEREIIDESEFYEDYVAIAPDAAEYLVERKVAMVGVDYLSVAPYSDPTTTHRILLKAGVWVVEGLDLRKVGEGVGQLLVMAIKIEGSDAAPARALFLPNSQES